MEHVPFYKESPIVNSQGTLAGQFITAELLMTLEQLGVFEYVAKLPHFSPSEIASKFGLKKKLLEATCNFLAVENIFSKKGPETFCLAIDYFSIKMVANFMLAYRDVFEQTTALLDGSKIYGKEIERDATRLGVNTTWTSRYLVDRLQNLEIKKVLDLGCGRGDFLLSLAENIPKFQGIGVDINEPVVEYARSRINTSPYKDLIRIFHADIKAPNLFPPETHETQALVASLILHELSNEIDIVRLLRCYKEKFSRHILFVAEVDTPRWDDILQEKNNADKWRAANYLFTHYFSAQGLPKPKDEWRHILKNSGWKIRHEENVPLRTTIFECE